MSESIANAEGSSYQPFQCLVCQSRFTRHENLKRHAALHSRSKNEASISCDLCGVTFSRRDLHRRHMKRKHPEQEPRGTKRLRRDSKAEAESGDGWTSQGEKKASISPGQDQQGILPQHLSDEEELEMGRLAWHAFGRRQPGRDEYAHQVGCGNLSTGSLTSTEDIGAQNVTCELMQQHSINEPTYVGHLGQETDGLEESLQLEASLLEASYHFGSQLYPTTTSQSSSSKANSDSSNFNQCVTDNLSPRDIPFLQEDWFPSNTQISRGFNLYFTHVSDFAPFLHQPTFNPTQTSPHLILSMLCLAYQYSEDPDCSERAGSGASLSRKCFHRARVLLASGNVQADDLTHNIVIVQAYLLLQICSMMYLCGAESAYGLKMHSEMISVARSRGLMQPISVESGATGDLESFWRQFIQAESHKRTILAVHQIDSMWYQFLSVPRSLSHLEIKHELPCPEYCWTASSSTQWAHRQLLARQSTPLVQYADAVRSFLAPEPDVSSLPAFDPYGTINIAQFLLSSARELSGWSTMTGRLSFERFEPLKSSLAALHPFTHPHGDTAKPTHVASCEATWQMAMIELQMWSPSHTCGVVQENIDAALNQSTYLASSCELPFEVENGKAIQPHIDWFLNYLDVTLDSDCEPPWISIYAYKAFLIAWQCMRGGLAGAMQIVGLNDTDIKGAITWAKKVFQRRQHRQLGKLIVTCLDALSQSIIDPDP